MLKSLYETDFNLWLEETAELLKQGKLEQLDIENLLEEIEAMGRSEKNALRSNLEVLLMHFLKWEYQPDKRSNSWRFTITEHRLRIYQAFEDSPSLKNYFETFLAKAYRNAKTLASAETGISSSAFPELCPFSVEQILDANFPMN